MHEYINYVSQCEWLYTTVYTERLQIWYMHKSTSCLFTFSIVTTFIICCYRTMKYITALEIHKHN